jgi:outer membrane receptor protein involved in Fe transport
MFAHFRAPVGTLARLRLPALLITQLASISAVAQVTGGHANAQFVRSWDENGDAAVSHAEYDDARVKRFAAADSDGSGSLSQADVRVTGGIYNVADEKYYLWPRVRFVNEGTTTLYGYVTGDGIGRYSEPGRNFRVSLAWQF